MYIALYCIVLYCITNLYTSTNIFHIQYFRDVSVSLTWHVRRGFKMFTESLHFLEIQNCANI